MSWVWQCQLAASLLSLQTLLFSILLIGCLFPRDSLQPCLVTEAPSASKGPRSLVVRVCSLATAQIRVDFQFPCNSRAFRPDSVPGQSSLLRLLPLRLRQVVGIGLQLGRQEPGLQDVRRPCVPLASSQARAGPRDVEQQAQPAPSDPSLRQVRGPGFPLLQPGHRRRVTRDSSRLSVTPCRAPCARACILCLLSAVSLCCVELRHGLLHVFVVISFGGVPFVRILLQQPLFDLQFRVARHDHAIPCTTNLQNATLMSAWPWPSARTHNDEQAKSTNTGAWSATRQTRNAASAAGSAAQHASSDARTHAHSHTMHGPGSRR